MDKLCKTDGIILRRIPLGEADQIITLLSRDHGKVGIVAKGARRIKSKFCGRIEPFYQVTVNYFQGKDLGHANEFEILSTPKISEMDLRSQSMLFYLGEITQKLVADSQECPEVYDLLSETLEHFRQENSEILLYSYIVKLLTTLGFMAPWDHCSRSGVRLELNEPLFLCMSDASVIRQEHMSPGDLRLTPSVIKWVNYMQKEPMTQLKRVKAGQGEKTEVWAVIQTMFGHLLNFPFKSQAFLQLNQARAGTHL